MAVLRPLKALAMMGDAAFVAVFVGFCTELGIQDADVCQGAVGSQAPIMAHVLRSVEINSPSLQTFCSTVFGLCPLQEVKPRTVQLSALPVNESSGADMVKRSGGAKKRWESKGREPFQVLHLSDTHVDWKYSVGAEAQCSKIICCRRYPELEGTWPYKNASTFGEPQCDTPPALLQSLLDAMDRTAPSRSFNIFTGDSVDDAVWDLKISEVSQDLIRWHEGLATGVVKNVSSKASSDSKPPTYLTFGNHDVVPVNAFPRDLSLSTNGEASPAWVYDLTAKDWEKWIGAEAAEQVRTKSGCYSRVHPGTDLRIISLNTNYWYKQNFWTYDTNVMSWDPNGIIAWFAEELDAAEKAGQRAWIVGHIPPGKADILRDQSNYLDQVFQRYHETIAAHFYGHSHGDEFEIAYSDYNARSAETANGIAFVGGAVTPTSGNNPVFRVYEVDPDTYEIMDFTVYITNLTSPSFAVEPEWFSYYSARDAYGGLLDPPHPAEAPLDASFWHRVTEEFEKNQTAFLEYDARTYRGTRGKCTDEACTASKICMARAMRSQDNCQVVEPHFSFRKRDLTSLDAPAMSSSFSTHLSAAHDPHQHDHFFCEGFGLASLLRSISSGEFDRQVEEREAARGRLKKRSGEGQGAALRYFQEEAHRAVRREKAQRRWWRRWRK
ncbi:hypothetical protein JCM6882_003735 [Rhodosporidiobolus microsporus]